MLITFLIVMGVIFLIFNLGAVLRLLIVSGLIALVVYAILNVLK